MKKVLAIMGGPRKNMNTDTLLDEFLRGVEENNEVEINKIYLKDKDIGLCIGCGYCEKTGDCFQRDDMDPIYDAFNNSDGIVMASPMYFGGQASLMKIMIDRCQIYWSSKYVLNNSSIDRDKKRHGALIVTAGGPDYPHKFDGFEVINGIMFDSINTKTKAKIYMCNSDKVPAKENEEAMKEAYEKGKAFFEGF